MTDEKQGTDDWHARRLGKVTGSRVFPVVDFDARGKPRAGYDRLMDELVKENLTGEPTSFFVSEAMRDGTRKEPIARLRFSFECDVDVQQVGFEDHPTIDLSGVSLDGLIAGENALIEIKCPLLKTHEGYWEDDRIPPRYLCQMYWGMACYPHLTHGYFVSFSDEAERDRQLLIRRVERNQKRIELMQDRVADFVEKLKARISVEKA